jgi:DNA-binding transcriptional LysR family regulator
MELHQLRTFEAVVRHRTVTDAAVALDRAPSSVSAQIRALERSLGVTLFERTAKGMRLTGAGERMLLWARRLLDQAERARDEVAGSPRQVRLGALETIAATYVPRVLARQLTPQELSGERLLVNVPNCSFLMAADRVVGPGPERVWAGGVPVMRAWAEHGLGLALLPEFAVTAAERAGTLTRLALPAPALSLRLVWHGDQEDLPGLRDVLYAACA